jgi:hypothetical protein
MSKLSTLALGLILVAAGLVTAAIAADEKVDVTGTWEVEIEIAGQTGTPSFTFKQDGDKLTGTYKGQFGESDIKGTVKGKDVEWSFEGQGAKVTYTGTVVDKDNMKGKADYAGQAEGTWKAKKKAKSS